MQLMSSPFFFFVKVNALTMMGGWVAIVSDRKSRIALLKFTCMMLSASQQHWFTDHVWYAAQRRARVDIMICDGRQKADLLNDTRSCPPKYLL